MMQYKNKDAWNKNFDDYVEDQIGEYFEVLKKENSSLSKHFFSVGYLEVMHDVEEKGYIEWLANNEWNEVELLDFFEDFFDYILIMLKLDGYRFLENEPSWDFSAFKLGVNYGLMKFYPSLKDFFKSKSKIFEENKSYNPLCTKIEQNLVEIDNLLK